MKYFKTESNGTIETRSSQNNDYAFAWFYRNISKPDDVQIGASFHMTFQAAQTNAKRYAKKSWLESIEIVPCVEITKEEFKQIRKVAA
jgi:hypothetical protein